MKYELAQLAPILSDTYGVIAYQEQVMRIAAVLAGFSMGQSDVLRKAMGKKDPKVMAKQREAFMEGARAKGVNEKKATKIFDLMEFFAGYGFNKSHSTTYALGRVSDRVSQGQLPAPFHGGAADDRGGEHRQARDVSRRVPRPRRADPAARHQRQRARVHRRPDQGVRFGLCAIKNVGEGAILSMLAVRKELGRIDSMYCAVRARRPPPRQQARAREPDQGRRARLAGARRRARRRCAGRGCSPRSIARSRTAAGTSATATRGSTSCSAGPPTTAPAAPVPLPEAAAWPETQQLAFEKEALGLYMSGHPLERFADAMKTFGAQRVAELAASEADVWVGGIVSGLRPLKTKKGDRMAVFMLDDVAGDRRNRRVPGDLRQARRADRGGRDAAGPRQVREGRGVRPARRDRADADAALKERTTREVAIHLTVPPHGRPTFEALAEVLSRHRGDRRV